MIKLDDSRDWLALAKQANWSVTKLARLCNISVRTLERHFVKAMGKSPKTWLLEQRQRQAGELLRENGRSVKEIASKLGYKQAHHFSLEFKRYWGVCPTQFTTNQLENQKCRIFV